MNNLIDKLAPLATVLTLIYAVLRLVVFLSPENRKNLRSNVSEIKSVATSNKKHLIIAVVIFFAAIAFLVFSIFDEPPPAEGEDNVIKLGGDSEKIEWIVIERNKDYWTLLSKNCFDARPYQTTIEKGKKLTWEKSTLKEWLNGEFVKNFSEEERNALFEFSEGGFVTLLNIKQAKKLEKENKDLMVCHTDSQEKSEAKEWWLQTPKEECVMFVNSSGKIQKSCTKYFENRADKSLFVRPVIRKKM